MSVRSSPRVSPTGPVLVLYPDTDTGSGLGHLARCFAVAEAWAPKVGQVVLVAPTGIGAIWQRRFETLGALIVPDGPPESDGWALIDDYSAGPDRQEEIASGSRFVAVVDDHGSIGRYEADLVIDQNLGADPSSYADRRGGAVLLAGSSYALVRAEFRRANLDRFPPEARRVLVALGGSPPAAARALMDSVAGQDALSDLDWHELSGRQDVATAMADCDLAVSASGMTAWELCCVGVPMVLTSLAGNQEPVGARLHEVGAALYLGRYERLTPTRAARELEALVGDGARRESMARAARLVVDGRGAARVVAEMRAMLLEARPVTVGDAELLYRWVNDPAVRAASFVTEPVRWTDHLAWLRSRLAAEDSRMYIVSHRGHPIAQIRFDRHDAVVEIGFSVQREARSAGWAAAVLVAGSRRVLDDLPDVSGIRGLVKQENVRSAAAFDAAGFRPEDRTGDTDPVPLRYIRRRDELLV